MGRAIFFLRLYLCEGPTCDIDSNIAMVGCEDSGNKKISASILWVIDFKVSSQPFVFVIDHIFCNDNAFHTI